MVLKRVALKVVVMAVTVAAMSAKSTDATKAEMKDEKKV